MPPRERFLILAGMTVAVLIVVLAEFFAIDLAISPERPSSAKISIVVFVVAGATVLAGVALLRPWVQALVGKRERLIFHLLNYGAIVLAGVGGFVLIQSIVEAENRLLDQRSACMRLALGTHRQDRDTGWEELLEREGDVLLLKDERIRLRFERGLSSAERKAREASLERRITNAEDRQKRTGERVGPELFGAPDDPLLDLVDEAIQASGSDLDEMFDRLAGVDGC